MFQRLRPYLFLLFVVTISYWQIAFLHNAVKWDMTSCFLPWRYFMGECLQNNIFPFWNPYQSLGYPFHIDMQVPVWSPEALWFGYFTDHGLMALQLLFVLYVFFAGVGMFRLIKYLTQNPLVSLSIATAYMLSGCIVSHVQHFHAVISCAYLPWIFLCFLKILDDPSWKNGLKASVFYFLLITSGYQTFTVITTYLLFLMVLFYFFRHYRNKQFSLIYKTIGVLLLFAFVSVLLYSPVIISFFQAKPYVSRFSEGLAYAKALANPFSPKSLISFFSPFSAVSGYEIFHTDLSMINAYFGIITLVLFISSLIGKFNSFQKVLFVFGMVCLLIAMGDYLPFFKFSRYLPMLGIFRFPSYYRFYTVFSFFVVTAFQLDKITLECRKYRKPLLISSGFVAFILCSLLVWALIKMDYTNISYLQPFEFYSELMSRGTIYENTLLDCLFQLVVLGVFCMIIYRNRKVGLHLLVLITLEMLVSVQLNIYKTAVSGEEVNTFAYSLKKQPKGFPKPDLSLKVKDVADGYELPEVYRNTNMIAKRISGDGFSSFYLNGFESIKNDKPNLYKAITNNPFIYLSDKIHPLKFFNHSLVNMDKDNLNIYLSDSDYVKVEKNKLCVSPTDTLFISSFSPNEIITRSVTKYPVLINLLQSDYPGWKIFIDNKETTKIKANSDFISAVLPSGKHVTRLVFENRPVLYSAYFSYFLFFFLITFFIVNYYKKEKNTEIKRSILLVIILSITFMGFKLYTNEPYLKTEKRSLEKIKSNIKALMDSLNSTNTTLVINADVDKNYFVPDVADKYVVRFDQAFDLYKMSKLIQHAKTDYVIYAWSNLNDPDEVAELIRSKYPQMHDVYVGERSKVTLFSNGKNYTRPCIFISGNDFEFKHQSWSYNNLDVDSTTNPLNHFNKLDSISVFSTVYELKVEDVTALKEQLVTVSVDAIVGENTDARIVFSIVRDHKSYVYKMKKIFADNNDWTKNVMIEKINKGIKPGDIIKIYVWNIGKSRIFLDNFRVASYKE